MSEQEDTTTTVETGNNVVEKQELKIIPAENPTKEELATIVAEVRSQMKVETVPTPTEFTFRKQKDDSVIEYKRDTLVVPLPIPTINGVLSIIEEGGKGAELLREAVTEVIKTQARSLISEDEKLNAANFPYDQLSWDFIANMPKASRKGGGIPKEIWEGFVKDYIEVMQEVTDKTLEQVTFAAKLFNAKLQPVKTNKKVLSVLEEQLGVYANAEQANLEEFAEVIEFLAEKITTFKETSESSILEAL